MDTVLTGLRDSNADVRQAAAWVLTQMDDAAAPAMDAMASAMEDPSQIVRGLVAIALRHVPSVNEAAGDALVSHLRDSDENVRMVVANAIAAHPDVARRGLDALMTAARVPGEHRHVLRSVATALGATGADGVGALPILRTLAEQPLVRWQAEAAIRVIEAAAR